MAKPKVAFYWCASCGGCEEAVVDLNEDLIKVAAAVDIVMWPVALDFKRKDIEALKDEEIAVTFLNGAIRLEEQEEMAKLFNPQHSTAICYHFMERDALEKKVITPKKLSGFITPRMLFSLYEHLQKLNEEHKAKKIKKENVK